MYAPFRAIGGDPLEPVVAPGRREGARHAVLHAAGRSGIHSEQIKLSIRFGSALPLRVTGYLFAKRCTRHINKFGHKEKLWCLDTLFSSIIFIVMASSDLLTTV